MKKIPVLVCIAALSTFLLVYCNTVASKNPATASVDAATASASPDSMVKRGAYLVSIMGCNDCHTPKKMGPKGPVFDEERTLSGHPAEMPVAPYEAGTAKNWILFNQMLTNYVGPWGTSFSANLTPDSTGIGGWTEAQFLKAIREGKYKGLDNSRPLLPPMPWQEYRNATDEDLKAIFAYLKSLKPIRNVVPAAKINMPPKS
ncbi:c-type cytochrome [Niastella populi]|uniref:Diheme cytochrome c-553 n=1 Tax=Niastella populi TaxID=550983 RepID=A0A1V9G826_9BACT|nr:c-type cytochrome [Niastella populi]OQP66732.1 diheme cytochrome c-553 [Niastella populi]